MMKNIRQQHREETITQKEETLPLTESVPETKEAVPESPEKETVTLKDGTVVDLSQSKSVDIHVKQ